MIPRLSFRSRLRMAHAPNLPAKPGRTPGIPGDIDAEPVQELKRVIRESEALADRLGLSEYYGMEAYVVGEGPPPALSGWRSWSQGARLTDRGSHQCHGGSPQPVWPGVAPRARRERPDRSR